MSAQLATRQQGVVTRGQLLAAGFSSDVIDHGVRTSSLHPVHRGIYVVGHLALAPRTKEVAALLACGEPSLIGRRSATHIWSLTEVAPSDVDVIVVGRRCRPKTGVRIHQLSAIDERDLRRKDGLPVTSPARTLIDLAAEASDQELERLVAEARVHGLLRKGELERALERAGRRPGTRRMWALLSAEGEPAITRSELERLLRRLLRDARLPQPKSNVKVAGWEVDFLWPSERVIVEVDSYRFHSHRSAFERDRRKDLALTDAGYLVIRVTWRQLKTEPLAVIVHIARALDRRARAHG